jgi:PAS domain S-box-containing protein
VTVEVLLLSRGSPGDDVAGLLEAASAPPALAARRPADAPADDGGNGGGGLELSREPEPANALDRIEAESPDVVLVDLEAFDGAGLDVLCSLLGRPRSPPVVVLTALATRPRAIEAVRHGAEEALVKEDATPELLVRSVYHAVERAANEQELARYEALVTESTDAIVIVDAYGVVEYVTPSVEQVIGYDQREFVGRNAFDHVHPADLEIAATEFQAVVDDPDYRASAKFRYQHEDGHWITLHARGRNLIDDPAVEGMVVYTHDITDLREAEQRLADREAGLHRTAEIMADRDRSLDERIDDVLDVVRETLGVEYGTVSRLREETYVFEFVSGDDAVQAGDTVPLSTTTCERTVAREQSLAIENFREEAPELADREGNRELGINCYIGSPIVVDDEVVGTFCCYGADAGDGFTEWDQAYVDMVARWIGSELERSRNTERLTVLNQLHGVVNDVTEAVIGRATREEMERTACRQLAESASYEFAWVAERDAATREVTARTDAGIEDSVADLRVTTDREADADPVDAAAAGTDGVAPESDGGAGTRDPTARALKTGEVRIVRDVFTDPRHEAWRPVAETYGFRSTAAIPIRHEETVYGVLNVYTDRADAFEPAERTAVEQLGEIIGHAIAAAQRKQALVSDAVVELDLELPGAFADVEAVADLKAPVRVDRVLSVSAEDYLVYGTTTADGIEGVETAARAVDAWEELSIIGEVPEGVAFELQLSEPPVLATVASLGGAVESAVIETGDYRLTAQFPTGTDVRGVVEALQADYPRVDVVARRQITRSGGAERFARAWQKRLTDRQRTALEAAYHAGFFEWPRDSAGQEVAETLDVAPPTFHQHLRTAERKLLATLFDGRPAPTESD